MTVATTSLNPATMAATSMQKESAPASLTTAVTAPKAPVTSKHRQLKHGTTLIEARRLSKHSRKLIARRLAQSLWPGAAATAMDHCRLPEAPSRVAYSEPLAPPSQRGGAQPDVAKPNSSGTGSASTTNTVVQFQEQVSVVEIPSHRSYPDQVHSSMWSNRKEIAWNLVRNRKEFAADGGDWRLAKEESEMLFYQGKLYHPVTYLAMQRENRKRLVRMLRKQNTTTSSTTGSSSTRNKDTVTGHKKSIQVTRVHGSINKKKLLPSGRRHRALLCPHTE